LFDHNAIKLPSAYCLDAINLEVNNKKKQEKTLKQLEDEQPIDQQSVGHRRNKGENLKVPGT
jgi:hypothetical protein